MKGALQVMDETSGVVRSLKPQQKRSLLNDAFGNESLNEVVKAGIIPFTGRRVKRRTVAGLQSRAYVCLEDLLQPRPEPAFERVAAELFAEFIDSGPRRHITHFTLGG